MKRRKRKLKRLPSRADIMKIAPIRATLDIEMRHQSLRITSNSLPIEEEFMILIC